MAKVLADPAEFRLQILVSAVEHDRRGRPTLRRYGYRVGSEYFYPASSIKLCAAVSALQLVEQLEGVLRIDGLADAPLEIGPLFPGDRAQARDFDDLAGPSGRPITIRREIRKLGLVSDNQAFNRLFDVVGHEALHRSMHALGLSSVVVNHRLSDPRNIANNRASAAVTFLPTNGPPIPLGELKSSLIVTNQSARRDVGSGYVRGKEVLQTPMDFTSRNGISLADLQDLLVKVARPDIDIGTPPLELSSAHRSLLLSALTEYPAESPDPKYSRENFPDHYGKFLLPGVRRVFPATARGDRIEITGKIGRAYGFTVENAYLVHPTTGRAVFVTAAIYTNRDGILNDDQYEYESVADPFMEDLGERVARRWLTGGSRGSR